MIQYNCYSLLSSGSVSNAIPTRFQCSGVANSEPDMLSLQRSAVKCTRFSANIVEEYHCLFKDESSDWLTCDDVLDVKKK